MRLKEWEQNLSLQYSYCYYYIGSNEDYERRPQLVLRKLFWRTDCEIKAHLNVILPVERKCGAQFFEIKEMFFKKRLNYWVLWIMAIGPFRVFLTVLTHIKMGKFSLHFYLCSNLWCSIFTHKSKIMTF